MRLARTDELAEEMACAVASNDQGDSLRIAAFHFELAPRTVKTVAAPTANLPT